MLSAYWADPHKEEHEKWWITKKLDQFNHWFNGQAANYRKVLAWALDHRVAMILIAAMSFFASFLLPSNGFSGLAIAVGGIALVVFGLTRKGFARPIRAALV